MNKKNISETGKEMQFSLLEIGARTPLKFYREQWQCKLCAHTSEIFILKFFKLRAIKCFKGAQKIEMRLKKQLISSCVKVIYVKNKN